MYTYLGLINILGFQLFFMVTNCSGCVQQVIISSLLTFVQSPVTCFADHVVVFGLLQRNFLILWLLYLFNFVMESCKSRIVVRSF